MNSVVQPITHWVLISIPIKRQVGEVGGVSRFFMTSRGLPVSPTMGNSFSDKLRTQCHLWYPQLKVGSCLAFQWTMICTWIIRLVGGVKMLWSSWEKQWVESSRVKYLSGSWGVCHHGDIPTSSAGSQTGHTWIGEKKLLATFRGSEDIWLIFFYSFISVKLPYTNLHILEMHSLKNFNKHLHLWNYHHNQDNEYIHSFKITLHPFVILLPYHQAAAKLFSVTKGSCTFSRIGNRIIESLRTIILKLVHVGVCQ